MVFIGNHRHTSFFGGVAIIQAAWHFIPFRLARIDLQLARYRFAEIEGTAVLTAILAQYETSIDHSKFPSIPGESPQVSIQSIFEYAQHQDVSTTGTTGAAA